MTVSWFYAASVDRRAGATSVLCACPALFDSGTDATRLARRRGAETGTALRQSLMRLWLFPAHLACGSNQADDKTRQDVILVLRWGLCCAIGAVYAFSTQTPRCMKQTMLGDCRLPTRTVASVRGAVNRAAAPSPGSDEWIALLMLLRWVQISQHAGALNAWKSLHPTCL
jgi:hypothetical protein